MTTKQIDYILELSQVLNFNRAAENLFTSQPTLTYQIKAVEEEIGFLIFNRSGKGISLTPAGAQFCISLRVFREDLNKAIEQGQNFSIRYQEDIKISLPGRSSIYFLPEIIREFANIRPQTSISPIFFAPNAMDLFLRNEIDIFYGIGDQCKRISEIIEYPLFESHFYLVTKTDDPLAQKDLIHMEDLKGRTLMVGGGSPPPLRAIQQRIINTIPIQYFNSYDHETTLTNIASDKGVCISPGFLNSHTPEFAWIPFDCAETLPCYLYTHKNNNRPEIKELLNTITDVYQKHDGFPL
ncbi:LysR family transcriptional regulator [Anaeromicropila herbilytica]|uniref:HTH lysR-type domain-containing protein n=1 Tax=Anaeromicropila herbilytica TaxID=2785025 RepID=A0A7R7ELP4_9FIRM|nr:LysR family transcriptional regulator [Anaeromicropila herbilytica]BCN31049.1 hypothetical protein bsdtb5_23440 [Anaeromicropila herbilytica]